MNGYVCSSPRSPYPEGRREPIANGWGVDADAAAHAARYPRHDRPG